MRTALGATLVLAACGTEYRAPTPDAPITWYQDVAPIVATHCMSCHQDGGIAPFSLTSFEDARDNSGRMLTQIHGGTMPPFYSSEEASCTPRFPWKGDPRLSPQEIQTLETWVADGLAEGTTATVPTPPNTNLAGVTRTLSPVVPFASSGPYDQFICYILDPQVGAGAFLTGLQVRPGNPEVVHHVVVSKLDAGTDQDALVAAHGVGMPFPCTSQPGSLVVTIWTPGNDPMQTPAGMSVPIAEGAKLVMQIHYHPAGTTHRPDATKLALRTTLDWPQRLFFIRTFGNADKAPSLLPDPDDRTTAPEFRIPANKTDHEEHMRFTVADLGTLTDVHVYSVSAHMHLIGTHISTHIDRIAPTATQPANECLQNGTWNFDWQRTYTYDTDLASLPALQKGDVIDMECHWNNSLSNPFEVRALADAGLVAPVDVTLGNAQSTDEMCIEIFGLSVPAPPQPAGRTVPSSLLQPVSGLLQLH